MNVLCTFNLRPVSARETTPGTLFEKRKCADLTNKINKSLGKDATFFDVTMKAKLKIWRAWDSKRIKFYLHGAATS